MSFAAPLFLLGLLAGVIPLLFHLIHRRNAVEVPFSTLRFLRLSEQRTRKRKYIEDVGLLLLRVLALVLIAVGLARPALTSLRLLWKPGTDVAAVIILDNSASMALIENDQPRFEVARQEAGQILDLLQQGDAVALLLTGGPEEPELGQMTHAHETIRQALSQCKVSYETADLAGRLSQARQLLAEVEAPHKEIYVITDNQALSWQGLDPDKADPDGATESPPVIVVGVGKEAIPNVALENLRLRCPAQAPGVPVQVVVDVRNTSLFPQQKHLELVVNGSRQAVSPTLDLPAGAKRTHTFHFLLDRVGVNRGQVQLAGEDGSALDNRLFFALTVDQTIPVAIVKPEGADLPYTEDAYYLERALAPPGDKGWAIQTTTLTPRELADASLSAYAVVFCVNLPPLDGTAASRLRDYVWSGGHLWWICGGKVQPAGYNAMNEQVKGALLPVALGELRQAETRDKESWHLGYLDPEHPALAPLTEPASLYQSVLVYRYFALRWTPDSGAQVLASLAEGEPLLVQRTVGAGSVLLLATAAHTDWTNLPVKPLFLPLMSRLTFHLAGSQPQRAQVRAGAPLLVPLGKSAGPVEVEVVRPGGEVLRVSGPEGGLFRYPDSHEAGIYLLRPLGGPDSRQHAYAVNLAGEEVDPRTLDREQLEERFAGQTLVFCSSPDELVGTVRRLREGESLMGWFLWAVLIGLVVETLVANRLRQGRGAQGTEKQTRARAKPAPPPLPEAVPAPARG